MAEFKKGGLTDGAGSEANWDEGKHPRDEQGKFSSGSESGFVNMQLFAADYTRLTDKGLSGSIKSHNKKIDSHTEKINHPEKHYIDWAVMDERERQGRIRQWEKEIINYKNQIAMAQLEISKRSKNSDRN